MASSLKFTHRVAGRGVIRKLCQHHQRTCLGRGCRPFSTVPQYTPWETNFDETQSFCPQKRICKEAGGAQTSLQFYHKQENESAVVTLDDFIKQLPTTIRMRQEELSKTPDSYAFEEDPVVQLFR
jgi:hypothetical protein